MTYRVVITENAKANLRGYYLKAAERAPLTAARWLNRFEQALETLSYLPLKCGLAAENGLGGAEIRQFLFGKRPSVFRALFTVVGDEVQVLHIRRATMDTATGKEIYG
jgi:plasmid stabilization system protein ParE